jgi:P4 family phage/plasmid primase-like protien
LSKYNIEGEKFKTECIKDFLNLMEQYTYLYCEHEDLIKNIKRKKKSIKIENINDKQLVIHRDTSLQIANRIKDKVKLLYVQKEWYLYNVVSGIYEIKDESYIDNVISLMENEEEAWFNKIAYRDNLIRDLKRCCFSKVEFDTNPDLLGFKNGVYDLSNGEFRIGRKDEYISMICGVIYDNEVDTTLASSIIESIFTNPVERQYAINRLSLCLDANNREQAITFNYGYTASNGKSFLMERMCNVLGDYSGSFTSILLTNRMRAAGDANVSLMNFKCKRFMYCSEPESGSKLNTNFIKLLTGDIIKARGLYSNKEDSIQPTFKIFMCCNELPNFDSYDEGIARRIRIIEYKTKFTITPKRKNEKKLIRYNLSQCDTIEAGLLVLLLGNYKTLRTRRSMISV